MTDWTAIPRPLPVGPERNGITIVRSPGTFDGWRRRCEHCGATVLADHVPMSPDCLHLVSERSWKR